MAFGMVRDRLLLCSASEDYVIVWDIDRCYTQIKDGNNACKDLDSETDWKILLVCRAYKTVIPKNALLWNIFSVNHFFVPSPKLDICVPGGIASGRVVGTLLGRVVHLSLCPLSAKVAACSGSRVFLLNAEVWNKIHTILIQWIENKNSYAETVKRKQMPFLTHLQMKCRTKSACRTFHYPDCDWPAHKDER